MIYLDYQATTPLAPEAAAAMRPWLDDKFANPHSPSRSGREAAAAVEVARADILDTLLGGVPEPVPTMPDLPWAFGAPPWDATLEAGHLYFTSGATEALNWAIKGTFARSSPERKRVVTVATEHAAALDSVRSLERHGAEIIVLPVDREGLVDWRAAADVVDEQTSFVAIMYVNNEIGVIQHSGLLHFSARARAVGAAVICDAAQAFGRIPVPLALCDMVAISAHKMHGPKGIGALWVRKGWEPEPLLHGGGQEGGLRSGTLAPALCAGFGAAAKSARERMAADTAHIWELYRRLREGLGQDWHVNGARNTRWRGNLNVWRRGVDAFRLISELREIAFSAGSACASGSGRPSHVLKALGLDNAQIRGSIRLGFGRFTTIEQVDEAVELINRAAARQLSFAA